MATDVHLCLLLHGLYGSPSNLWCLEDEVDKAHAAAGSHLELAVLNATSYSGPKTWDGVDVIAHGVAQEVSHLFALTDTQLDAEISRLESEGKRVVYLSVTGYSLGGLIARTLVGQLYARPGFFARHRPAFFSTIATPHLGVLRYGSWRSAWMHAVGQHMFSRTGQQLFCLDTDHGEPFLAVLADPSRIYYRALAQFARVLFVANGVGDLTVPYCTAAAERHDPFVDYEAGRLGLVVHDHIVQSAFTPQDEDEVDAIVGEALVPAAPARPWLPPFFYLPYRPVRYVLFPLIPVLVPVALTFAALAMAVHSYHSARRLRALTSNQQHHRIFGLEAGDYGVSGDTPAITRRGSPEPAPDSGAGAGSDERGRGASCEVCEDAEATGDTDGGGAGGGVEGGEARPLLAETGGGDGPGGPALVPPSQPLLTPLQERIVASLGALPQLERLTAWFPGVFNAHAVVVARNARIPRWAWQGVGRHVVAEWARRCVGAVQAAAGAGPASDTREASVRLGGVGDADDDGSSPSERGSRASSQSTEARSREHTIEVAVAQLRPSPSDSERSHSIA